MREWLDAAENATARRAEASHGEDLGENEMQTIEEAKERCGVELREVKT